MRVKVGSNFRDVNEGTLYEAESYKVHPRYFGNRTVTRGDVGVIRTKTEIDYVIDEERDIFVVNSICVPQPNILNQYNEYAVLAAFGSLEDKIDSKMPTLLQKTVGVIYGWTKCDADMMNICFDMGSAAGCSGDSGSPLIQYNGDKAILIGLISGQEPDRSPGDFCSQIIMAARVGQYVYFLRQQVWPEIYFR